MSGEVVRKICFNLSQAREKWRATVYVLINFTLAEEPGEHLE
jgi:hypothetical protein